MAIKCSAGEPLVTNEMTGKTYRSRHTHETARQVFFCQKEAGRVAPNVAVPERQANLAIAKTMSEFGVDREEALKMIRKELNGVAKKLRDAKEALPQKEKLPVF